MNRLSRSLLAAVALLLGVVSGPRAAQAADDTVIIIGDRQVIRIRADHAGVTAAQRAAALRQRLLDIYEAIGKSSSALQADEVTLDLQPGAPSIRVRGLLLLTVTPEDAKVNGYKTPEDLARVWHPRLRDALVRAAPLPETLEYPGGGGEPQPSPAPSAQPGSQSSPAPHRP